MASMENWLYTLLTVLTWQTAGILGCDKTWGLLEDDGVVFMSGCAELQASMDSVVIACSSSSPEDVAGRLYLMDDDAGGCTPHECGANFTCALPVTLGPTAYKMTDTYDDMLTIIDNNTDTCMPLPTMTAYPWYYMVDIGPFLTDNSMDYGTVTVVGIDLECEEDGLFIFADRQKLLPKCPYLDSSITGNQETCTFDCTSLNVPLSSTILLYTLGNTASTSICEVSVVDF